MKLSFSTLVSPGWSLAQIVEHAAANRIDGVDFRGIQTELDITRLSAFNANLPATLDLFAKHHLSMPCFNSSVTLVTPTATKWEPMLDEARRYAALAARTGTRYLRVFGGAIPAGMSRDDARQLANGHLRELAAICNPFGCKPLIETHDSWIVSSLILPLLEGLSHDQAGILWDLEHPWRQGESPAVTAAAFKGRLDHIHIKDTVRRQGKSVPMLLGEGEIPLADCIKALQSIGYDGWICLETEKRWHSEGPEPEQSVPQFAEYMRKNLS